MKIFPQTLDLHLHTIISDGTDSPAELLKNIVGAGIEMFSITDHDAISGASEMKQMLTDKTENDGGHCPLFISGVEFSCREDDRKYHILGYGYDPDGPSINAMVEKGHGFRMKKVMARLEFLDEEFGIVFDPQDVEKLLANQNPGKPHIAKMMIDYGIVSTIKEAMTNYLDKKKFRSSYILPEEAIRALLESGGIPVLAHPFYGDGSQLILGEEMDERLRHLMSFGLQGVECYYSGFTAKLVEQMLEFADKYDLYVTAGSDYHGTNKMVPIGDTNLNNISEAHRRLKDFVEIFL